MEKRHSQSQISDNFHFGPKVHFVYFLVPGLERGERNLLGNGRRVVDFDE